MWTLCVFSDFTFSDYLSYFFTIVGSAVKIYSVATGQVVSTLSSLTSQATSRFTTTRSHSDVITGVALHPENSFQLITSSLDGTIKIWDFLDAVLLQTIDLSQPIFRMCVHEKFPKYVFVSAGRPTKRTNKKGAIVHYALAIS
jgi:NET1-associated nuclear protein 1 (U3 small nucleolar RNA-associated protein 17)